MQKLKWILGAGIAVFCFTVLQIAPAFFTDQFRMEVTFEVLAGDLPPGSSMRLSRPQGTLQSLSCTGLADDRVRCSFVGGSLFDAENYLAKQGIETSNRFIDISSMPVFGTPVLLAWQFLLAMFAWWLWRRWFRWRQDGRPTWRWRNPGTPWLIMAPYAASAASVGVVFALFGAGANAMHVDARSVEQNLWLVVVTAVVVAPFYEEVIFRGIAFDSLRRAFPWPVAAVMTSLTFVSLHTMQAGPGGIGQFTGFLSAAIALCWIRKITGSLALCIVAHAVFNAIFLATTVRMQHGHGSDSFGILLPVAAAFPYC